MIDDAAHQDPQETRCPGLRARVPQNGDGVSAGHEPEKVRAAQSRLDPYGGYNFLGVKNRFQETSRLVARLHRYELTLRRHWWILTIAVVLGLAPADYHILSTPASYQSVGKLFMTGKLDIKEGQLYNEELGSFVGTQVEILKSSTLYSRALTNILIAHPDWKAEFTIFAPGEPASPFKVRVIDFPKTAVIEVKAVGRKREATRDFVNALMEEYQAFRKGIRSNTSAVTISTITEQVEGLEKDVRRRQGLLQAFLATNNLVLLQEEGSSAGAFAARLSKQLAALRTELKLLRIITPEQLAQSASKTPLLPAEEPSAAQGTANELLATLAGPQADFFRASQQIQLLEAKREELLEFLRPTHPKILRYDETIAEQQRIVEVFKRESLTQMASRRKALEVQIKSLESETAEWEARALDASRRMADYERLRQDVQRTQALYERLLGVIQQVDVNRTLDQDNVRVMDAASKPKPVRRILIYLGMGLSAGLCFGLGVFYIVSLFDDRFASLTELAGQIPEVVIGQVPNIHGTKNHPSLDLIAVSDTRHSFCESFRNIRSWVFFGCERDKRPRLLLVTSSVPAEGKSTISSNLAVTLALAGSRVLLVNADLRRAGLSPVFKVTRDAGLADILEQQSPSEDLVRPTATKGLWFLPAGLASVNPGELFLAPSCDLFLARVRSQYDYVILDSAPVLATDDTANLAPRINAVLYLVRADFTSARNAREGINVLRQRKANILGLVFNHSIGTRAGGYYYRYNDYHYEGYYGQRRRRCPAPGPAAGNVAETMTDKSV